MAPSNRKTAPAAAISTCVNEYCTETHWEKERTSLSAGSIVSRDPHSRQRISFLVQDTEQRIQEQRKFPCGTDVREQLEQGESESRSKSTYDMQLMPWMCERNEHKLPPSLSVIVSLY